MSEPIENLEQLKPCPWCGHLPDIESLGEDGYYITCGNGNCESCEAVSPEAWNIRPIEDALTAECDALRALVQQQEDLLNRILQPGERWLELRAAAKEALVDDNADGWMIHNGAAWGLAEARVAEAIRDTLKEMVKKMSEELRPCPWCGGTPTLKLSERFGSEVSPSMIRCRRCNFYMAKTGSDSDREVIQHWNKRAIEVALDQQVDDLTAELKELITVLAATRDRLREAEAVIRKVEVWASAYPLDLFPEPDVKLCENLLRAGGQSMDCLAAYARRGAMEWIQSDVRAYFATYQKER